jgi:hypothetical protein
MDEQQPGAKKAVVSAAVPKTLVAPHGLEQILATFGDIYEYIDRNGMLDPLVGGCSDKCAIALSATALMGSLKKCSLDHMS